MQFHKYVAVKYNNFICLVIKVARMLFTTGTGIIGAHKLVLVFCITSSFMPLNLCPHVHAIKVLSHLTCSNRHWCVCLFGRFV